MSTTRIIEACYSELHPSKPLDKWHSDVIEATELVINGCLMKLPWFSSQRTRIEAELGGYRQLFHDAMGYVLSHARSNPDDPHLAINDAAADLAVDLRAYDDEPFATSIHHRPYEVVVSVHLNAPISLRAMRVVDKAPDPRGREILLDIAAGSSLRAAADNNGITPQAAHARLKRLRKQVKEDPDV